MEEALSSIIQGCKLSRDLELNLPNQTKQPNLLASSCDEIVRVFNRAIDQLKPSYFQMGFPGSQEPELDAAVQELLRSNTQAMDLLEAQLLTDKKPFDLPVLPESKMGTTEASAQGLGLEFLAISSGATDMDYVGNAKGSTLSGGEGEFQVADGSDSGKSPAVQRLRKRTDVVEIYRVKAAVPGTGNTEIPPDDGLPWRKYGQKEILGSRFPRSYYRCTHKSFYGCQAKKQVQRLDNDPNTLEVTYYGHHICLMSSTAPPPVFCIAGIKHEMLEATPPPISSSIPPNRCFSAEEIEPKGGAETNSTLDSQLGKYRDIDMGGGVCSSDAASGPSQQAPADGKEVECPVVDLADAMFNPGSSTSNSMDAIFPSIQDK